MATHDYGNRRFSKLSQIDTRNVGRLQIAWTFDTGVPKGHEAAPLVVGDTMYLVTPFPNRLYALDLTKPGAPVKWKVAPPSDAAAQGVACCDVVNRGAAYDDGRVYFNTLDNHTLAVEARTGKTLWTTKLGDIGKGETMTMAPMVVKGKVLVGNSGGEMGVRGWLTALDGKTGSVAWRAYSAGPDADCLIGPSFQPCVSVLFVFATGLHTGLLGVLLTFARQLWYPIYDARARGAGADALSDQTLAGLIMWVPAGAILLAFGLGLLAAWLAEAERRARHS